MSDLSSSHIASIKLITFHVSNALDALLARFMAWRSKFLSVALFLFLFSCGVTAETAPEQQLRAAIVIGILKFVEFPSGKPDHISLCVVGKPLSKSAIDHAIGQSLIRGITIKIRLRQAFDDVEACDAVLTNSSVELDAYFKRHELKSFIICEDCQQFNSSSAVSIRRVEDRVGFFVNLEVADKLGVRLGSNILELASGVKRSSRVE